MKNSIAQFLASCLALLLVSNLPADDKINYLLGITPTGEVYPFAKNASSASEFTGATFSPDGTTLFVNRQGEGQTFAITGPWKR